jgi:hypothetical protein
MGARKSNPRWCAGYAKRPGCCYLERVERIELSHNPWQGPRLPLHHTRLVRRDGIEPPSVPCKGTALPLDERRDYGSRGPIRTSDLQVMSLVSFLFSTLHEKLWSPTTDLNCHRHAPNVPCYRITLVRVFSSIHLYKSTLSLPLNV